MSSDGCGCLRAKHVHGTVGMYQKHRCRCVPCKKAKSDQRKYCGADSSVDADMARQKIESLNTLGVSFDQIAEAAGVHATTIRNVAGGRAKRIRGSVNDMILNVPLASIAESSKKIPSVLRKPAPLAQAQMRELYALGWNAAALLKATGLSKEPCRVLLHEGVASAKVEERVAQGYELLRRQIPPGKTSFQRGVTSKARRFADANKWDSFMAEFAA